MVSLLDDRQTDASSYSDPQIRKMQRMCRETAIQAMESGALPYERSGRIRYARLCDVIAWEERRLQGTAVPTRRRIDPDFEDLA